MLLLGTLFLAFLLLCAARTAPGTQRVAERPVACRQVAPRDRVVDGFLEAVKADVGRSAREGCRPVLAATEVVDVRAVVRVAGPDGRERLLVTALRGTGEGSLPLLLEVAPGAWAAGARLLVEGPGGPRGAAPPAQPTAGPGWP